MAVVAVGVVVAPPVEPAEAGGGRVAVGGEGQRHEAVTRHRLTLHLGDQSLQVHIVCNKGIMVYI